MNTGKIVKNIVLKHLPGRHNQKLHGRRGSADRHFDISDNVDWGDIRPSKADIKNGFPHNSAVEVAHKLSNTAWGNDYPPTTWNKENQRIEIDKHPGKRTNPSSISYSVDKNGTETIRAHDSNAHALAVDYERVYKRPERFNASEGRILVLTRKKGESAWKISHENVYGNVRVSRDGEVDIDYDSVIKQGWALPLEGW